MFCCWKRKKEPRITNVEPPLDIDGEDYVFVVENLCVFKAPRYLVLLEGEVRGKPNESTRPRLPPPGLHSNTMAWPPRKVTTSYLEENRTTEPFSDVESIMSNRTYYETFRNLTQRRDYIIQVTANISSERLSPNSDVQPQHEKERWVSKESFPFVNEEVEIKRTLISPYKKDNEKPSLERDFSATFGKHLLEEQYASTYPMVSSIAETTQKPTSRDIRPYVVWKSQEELQQCMLETSQVYEPEPGRVKSEEVSVDIEPCSYFDMVPKRNENLKANDLQSPLLGFQGKPMPTNITVGNVKTPTSRKYFMQEMIPLEVGSKKETEFFVHHVKTSTPRDHFMREMIPLENLSKVNPNRLDSSPFEYANSAESRKDTDLSVHHTVDPIEAQVQTQDHRRDRSVETSPREVLVKGNVQVMRYFSESKTRLFPRVPPPAFVTGRLVPVTADEQQQLHAYLNQYSAVLIRNLKDPIPKDPGDSLQAVASARRPLAESISQVGSTRYQTQAVGRISSKQSDNRPSRERQRPEKNTQPDQTEPKNADDMRSSNSHSSKRDTAASHHASFRREHEHQTSSVPHHSSSRRDYKTSSPTSSTSDRKAEKYALQSTEYERQTDIRPQTYTKINEYGTKVLPPPQHDPQIRGDYRHTRTPASGTAKEFQQKGFAYSGYEPQTRHTSSGRDYGSTRPSSSRSHHEGNMVSWPSAANEHLTSIAPITSSKQGGERTRPSSSRQYHDTSHTTSSKLDDDGHSVPRVPHTSSKHAYERQLKTDNGRSVGMVSSSSSDQTRRLPDGHYYQPARTQEKYQPIQVLKPPCQQVIKRESSSSSSELDEDSLE